MAAPAQAPRRNPFRRVSQFYLETVDELRKASWPDWPELRDSTLLVIITVAILGVYICASDFSLFNLIKFFTNAVAASK
jgi:preprotein translocase subunit SecE